MWEKSFYFQYGDEDEDESDSVIINTSTIKSSKTKPLNIKQENNEKSGKSKSSKEAKLKEQMVEARVHSELILKQEIEGAGKLPVHLLILLWSL